MSDSRSPQPSQAPMVFRLPEYKAVYSDAFSVRATPIDLQITFSVTTALPVTNVQAGTSVQVAALMEQFTVALPLPIAKAISQHFSHLSFRQLPASPCIPA